jgi:hypothetical protein
MDSTKKKTAISGIKKVAALLWCLENLTDRMISVIIQDRLRGGTNANRKRRRVNPESIRLNPKIKSNLPPTKRINGNWVKKIAMPLKIFSFGSYKYNLIVRKYALNCLLYRIMAELTCRRNSGAVSLSASVTG